jgi:hypothetical protein
MNITVTFTDCGGMDAPEGTVIVFEDVDDWQVTTPADIEDIDCAAEGCHEGGSATPHRRFTGVTHLTLEASGTRAGGPRWKVPEAVT